MSTEKAPEAVSSVLKVFGILEALGEQKSIGVTELSQRLMMSKSTVYRFLQTMKSQGYVSQDGEADKYSLTLKLFQTGSSALKNIELLDIASREMKNISQHTNEALHLAIRDDDSIVYIHRIASGYSLKMECHIGKRNPMYSTAIGKVLLAFGDLKDAEETLSRIKFVKRTAKTLESPDQVLAELKTIREQGFSEDNEEQEVGLKCLAVPVFDRFGEAIAGLSISLPVVRFDEKQKSYYIDLIQKGAKSISEQLGFRNYDKLLQEYA